MRTKTKIYIALYSADVIHKSKKSDVRCQILHYVRLGSGPRVTKMLISVPDFHTYQQGYLPLEFRTQVET